MLAVDYRGFGDSSDKRVTEETVGEDARVAISWLREKLSESEQLMVWGHSLGAAIACRAVAEENIEKVGNSNIANLILESPFNNLEDEVFDVVLASKGKITKALGTFLRLGKQLKKAKMEFKSDAWISEIACPALLLHAEDDDTINIDLARKLFKAAKAGGKDRIDMITVESSYGLGHNDIFRYHRLPDVLRKYCQM